MREERLLLLWLNMLNDVVHQNDVELLGLVLGGSGFQKVLADELPFPSTRLEERACLLDSPFAKVDAYDIATDLSKR